MKVEREQSRIESIFHELQKAVDNARAIERETDVLSQLITGDSPKHDEALAKEEPPDSILSGLMVFADKMNGTLQRIAKNVDFVKEQVGTDRLDVRKPVNEIG
jgi:hypothetical protein